MTASRPPGFKFFTAASNPRCKTDLAFTREIRKRRQFSRRMRFSSGAGRNPFNQFRQLPLVSNFRCARSSTIARANRRDSRSSPKLPKNFPPLFAVLVLFTKSAAFNGCCTSHIRMSSRPVVLEN